MKRIILTGGGTAGHVTPNIALLPRLKELGYDIQYIGSYEGIEKKLIEENEKLKNQNNKNSNNSSKPSSTNVVTPKKKTGANLYNYRVKISNRKGGHTTIKDII